VGRTSTSGTAIHKTVAQVSVVIEYRRQEERSIRRHSVQLTEEKAGLLEVVLLLSLTTSGIIGSDCLFLRRSIARLIVSVFSGIF
jgi:hypothetical protein